MMPNLEKPPTQSLQKQDLKNVMFQNLQSLVTVSQANLLWKLMPSAEDGE